MGRLYSIAGIPAARMPRGERINAGPLLGLLVISFPWALAAAVAFL
jgi:hypothetical protein